MPIGIGTAIAGGAAVLGAGASIYASSKSASAQKKAAQSASDTSLQVAEQNNALFRETRDKNVQLASPYYNNGLLASNALTDLLLGTHLYNQNTVANPTVPGGGAFPPTPVTGANGQVLTAQQQWAQQALDNIMPSIGPKRTAKAMNIADPVARLNYLQGVFHSDERQLYNSWLAQNPRPTATTTAPAGTTAPVTQPAATPGPLSQIAVGEPTPTAAALAAPTTAAAPTGALSTAAVAQPVSQVPVAPTDPNARVMPVANLTAPAGGNLTSAQQGNDLAAPVGGPQAQAWRSIIGAIYNQGGTPQPGGVTTTPTPTPTPAPTPAPTTGTTTPAPSALSAWDQFRQGTNYQWRFNEGNRALTSNYAVRGVGDSGAERIALQEQGQNFASNELSNYMNLLAGQQNVGLTAGNAVMGVSTAAAGNIAQQNTNAGNTAANAALASGQASATNWGNVGGAIGQAAGALGQFGASGGFGGGAPAASGGALAGYNASQNFLNNTNFGF